MMNRFLKESFLKKHAGVSVDEIIKVVPSSLLPVISLTTVSQMSADLSLTDIGEKGLPDKLGGIKRLERPVVLQVSRFKNASAPTGIVAYHEIGCVFDAPRQPDLPARPSAAAA
jgi:hypothetical protein